MIGPNPPPPTQPLTARASLSERPKSIFGGPADTNGSSSATINRTESVVSSNTTANFFSLNPNAAPYAPPSSNQSILPPMPTTAAKETPSNGIPTMPLTLSRSPSPSARALTPSLKIDISAPASPAVYSFPSPKIPPQLSRKAPISLPSTPTINFLPSNALVAHLRDNLSTSVLTSSPLSPLTLQTPAPTPSTSHIHNFSPAPRKTKGLGLHPTLSAISLNGDSIPPQVVAESSEKSRAVLKKKAYDFYQASLSKRYYGRWKTKFSTTAKWIKAYQRSDAYRQKIQKARQSHNASPDRKRTISISVAASSESPYKKRAKRRISSDYQPPRDDEELAKRFKEVQIVLFHPSLLIIVTWT